MTENRPDSRGPRRSLGILSLGASMISICCWLRYGSIHWRGPIHDWIGALFGQDMSTYNNASRVISIAALLLAYAQIWMRRLTKSQASVIEGIAVLAAIGAVLFTWLVVT